MVSAWPPARSQDAATAMSNLNRRLKRLEALLTDEMG
jgi:hypothetical protein